MTRDVLRFIDALGLEQIDLLGFSLGGYIAQELALVRPRLVRRIVLAGTAPQGAPGSTAGPTTSTRSPPRTCRTRAGFLRLFFSGSDESRAKGMDVLRADLRADDRS